MNFNRICCRALPLFLLPAIVGLLPKFSLSQTTPANAPVAARSGPVYSAQGTPAAGTAPVSYASVAQIDGMLAQLDASAKATQDDLTRLRVEHWKTDANYKKQILSDTDSIERNLQEALPAIMTEVRNAPEDLPATFKLYRNLDALYDVLGSVTESAGAFGSKDNFQALSNDLSGFEGTRKALAQRIETLASAKESEIARLRTDLKAAQAAIPTAPPKKVIVDDTEPPKKPPVRKKPRAKKPASTAKPATGQKPPAQQPAPAAKPQ